jgi:hypothetical protein
VGNVKRRNFKLIMFKRIYLGSYKEHSRAKKTQNDSEMWQLFGLEHVPKTQTSNMI